MGYKMTYYFEKGKECTTAGGKVGVSVIRAKTIL
jgi:hypothetical protein